MASDGEIVINTKIDNSQLKKGTTEAGNLISKIGNSKTVNGLANIGATISGVGVAFQAAGKVIQKTKEVIDDLTNTYKEQAKAEIQLETAAKNNPYLDEASVRQLKKYASGLQSISTVGDEKLIPLMGQLAASGRTQVEIQQIMSAALDASASGAISLESAVQGLNQSYSGQIGMLGRQLPMLKNLTAEELKQGKAVEAVAKAYKGMAEKTSEATGTAEQLKNAWGDFKEHIGEGLEHALAPVRKLFTNMLNDINDVISRSKELKNANLNISSGTATVADYDVKIEQTKSQIEALEKTLAQRKKEYLETGIDNGIGQVRMELEKQLETLRIFNMQKGKVVATSMAQAAEEKKIADEAERAAAAQERAAKAKQAMTERALTAREQYDKAVMAVEYEIKAREQLGEKISDNEKALMRYNAKVEAYKRLITSSEGAISGNLDLDKKTAEDIRLQGAKLKLGVFDKEQVQQDFGKLIEDLPKKQQKKLEKLGKKMSASMLPDLAEFTGEYTARLEELKAMADEYIKSLPDGSQEQISAEQAKAEALISINKEMYDEIDRLAHESEEKKKDETKKIVDEICAYITEISSGMNDVVQKAGDLMLESVKNRSDAELAVLEKKYRQGEISEEEYEEQRLEIKREAAKEEYKIQMFQWTSNALMAAANIATGVTKAIADGGIMGLITGALVAAAGAVQIASIVASKPTPPNFAGGGIVQGNSYTGDNVRANVNSGEMILNATQQKSLWEVANGRGANGSSGANITINNSAANIVNAQPRLTKDQIEIMIDARVNDSLKNGRYDQSLTMANQGMSGDYYGI